MSIAADKRSWGRYYNQDCHYLPYGGVWPTCETLREAHGVRLDRCISAVNGIEFYAIHHDGTVSHKWCRLHAEDWFERLIDGEKLAEYHRAIDELIITTPEDERRGYIRRSSVSGPFRPTIDLSPEAMWDAYISLWGDEETFRDRTPGDYWDLKAQLDTIEQMAA